MPPALHIWQVVRLCDLYSVGNVNSDIAPLGTTVYNLRNTSQKDTLVGRGTLLTNANMNDYKIPGMYTLSAKNYTASPSGVNTQWGLFIIFRAAESGSTQQVIIGTSAEPQTIYFRRYGGAVWGSWMKISGQLV